MLKSFKKFFSRKNTLDKIEKSRNKPFNAMKESSISSTRYSAAYCQSPGKERAHNEDTILTFSSVLFGGETPTSFGIYLVADGMGGHQSGEVASRLAAQAACQYLVDNVFKTLTCNWNDIPEASLQVSLNEAVHQAQESIQQQVPGGGTTLTLCLNINEKFYSAHVGDSRLYVLNNEFELVLRTKDHSLVKRLIDLGEISEYEAADHPQKNVLIRALGQLDPFEPDIDHFVLNAGERLMICSDGLWGVVDELEIYEIINNAVNIDQAAVVLVQSANDHGGPDNISVVLIERLV